MRALNFEEIRPLLHGALAWHVSDGALTGERFTAAQQEFYASARPEFSKKLHTTASMRLEFDTNATAVEFAFRATPASTRSCVFDVTVDGVLLDSPIVKNMGGREEIVFSLTRLLDGNSHRVRVYLSAFWAVQILRVAVSDGATLAPVTHARKILCLGDSITQGFDAIHPMGHYVNLIADELDAEAINTAIGGDIFRPGALDPAFPFSPDVITVAFGTNDCAKCTRDEVTANATAYFERLRSIYPHAQIVAITPIWNSRHEEPRATGLLLSDVAAIIRSAAAAVGAHIVEGMLLVPNMAEFFFNQHSHPNDNGFAHYARNLLRALRPILR